MASLMAYLLLLLTFFLINNYTFGYSWSGLGRFNYDLDQDSSNSSNNLKSYLNKFCEFPKNDEEILQKISKLVSQEPSNPYDSEEKIVEKLKNDLTTALQLRSNIIRVLNHLLSYTNFTDKNRNEIQALELLIKGITNREVFVGKLLPLTGILDRGEKVKNLKTLFSFLGDILPGVYKSATEILDDFVDKEEDDDHLKEVIPFIFHKIKPSFDLTPKYIEMDSYFKPLFKVLEKNTPGIQTLDSELVDKIFNSYPYFSNIMQIQEYLSDLSTHLKKNPQINIPLSSEDLTTKNLLNKISDIVMPDTVSRRSLGNEKDEAQLGIPESKKEQINLINKIFKNLAKYEMPEDIIKGLDALFNKKRQLLSVLPYMNSHNNVMETIAELLSIIVRVSQDNPKVPKKILSLTKSLYQNIKFQFLYNENNYKNLDKVTIPKILDFYGHILDDDFQKKLETLKEELVSRNQLNPVTIKFGANPKKILKDFLIDLLQEKDDNLSFKITEVLRNLDNNGDYRPKFEEEGPTEEPKRRNERTTAKKPVTTPKTASDIVYVQNSYEDYLDPGKITIPRTYYGRKNAVRKFNGDNSNPDSDPTPVVSEILETATPTTIVKQRNEEEPYSGMDEAFHRHKSAISELNDLKKKLERFFSPHSRRSLEESTTPEGTTKSYSSIFKKLENLFKPSTPETQSGPRRSVQNAIKDERNLIPKSPKPNSRFEKDDADSDDKISPADALKNLLTNSGFTQRDVVNLYNGLYDFDNRESKDIIPFNDFITSLYEKSKDHDLSTFKHSLKKGVVPDSLINIITGSRRDSASDDLQNYYPHGRQFDPTAPDEDENTPSDNRRSGTKPDLLNLIRKMIKPRIVNDFYNKNDLKPDDDGRDRSFEQALFDFINQNGESRRSNINHKGDIPTEGLPNPQRRQGNIPKRIDELTSMLFANPDLKNLFTEYQKKFTPKESSSPSRRKASEDKSSFVVPKYLKDLQIVYNRKSIPLSEFLQTFHNQEQDSPPSRRSITPSIKEDTHRRSKSDIQLPEINFPKTGNKTPIKDLAGLARYLNTLITANLETRKATNVDVNKVMSAFQRMLSEKDNSFRKRNPTFLNDFLNPQRRSGAGPEEKLTEPKTPEDKLKVVLATGVLKENQLLRVFKEYKNLPETQSRRGFFGMIGGFAKWIWDTLNEKINLPKLALTAGTHLLQTLFGKSESRRMGSTNPDEEIDDIILPKRLEITQPFYGQHRRSMFVEDPIYKLQKFDPVPKLWKTLWECTFSSGSDEELSVPYLGGATSDFDFYSDIFQDKSFMDMKQDQHFGSSSQKFSQNVGDDSSAWRTSFEGSLENKMEKLYNELKAERSSTKGNYEEFLKASVKIADEPQAPQKESDSLSSIFSNKISDLKSNIKKYAKDVISPYLDDSKTTNDLSTDQTTKATTKLIDSTTLITTTPPKLTTILPETSSQQELFNTQKSARRFMQNDSFDLKSKSKSSNNPPTSRHLQDDPTTSVPKTTSDGNSKIIKIKSSIEEELKKRSLQNNTSIVEENRKSRNLRNEDFKDEGEETRRKNASEVFKKM